MSEGSKLWRGSPCSCADVRSLGLTHGSSVLLLLLDCVKTLYKGGQATTWKDTRVATVIHNKTWSKMAVRVKRACWLQIVGSGCGFRVGRGRTWNGGGFWRGPEREGSRFRFAPQVFGHNGDVIVRVPFQTPQHNVLAAIGQADLWLPVLAMLLQVHTCTTVSVFEQTLHKTV